MVIVIFLVLSALSFLCNAIGIQAKVNFDALGKTFLVTALIFWKAGL